MRQEASISYIHSISAESRKGGTGYAIQLLMLTLRSLFCAGEALPTRKSSRSQT